MSGTIDIGIGLKNPDGQGFQIEMDNVAPAPGSVHNVDHVESFPTAMLLHPSYIQKRLENANISHGSGMSLDSRFAEQQSDIQPLTTSHLCRYEECLKYHSSNNNKNAEYPISPLKNIFFYLVLIMLLVWILVYAVLNKMDLL